MENNEFIKDINFKEKLLLDFLQSDIPKYVSHYTGAEDVTSIIKHTNYVLHWLQLFPILLRANVFTT